MINVSNDYKERMKESRDFRNYAEITFVDGSKMTVDASNFTASNNSLMDGASTSSFPIGVAVSKSAQIELINDEQQFQGKDFFGAKIRLYTDFQLDEVDPWVGRNLLKGSHKNPESVSSKGWNYIILRRTEISELAISSGDDVTLSFEVADATENLLLKQLFQMMHL